MSMDIEDMGTTAPNEAARTEPAQAADSSAAKDYEAAGFGRDEGAASPAARQETRSEGAPNKAGGPEKESAKPADKADTKPGTNKAGQPGAYAPEDFRDVFPELEGDAEGSAINAEMAKLCAEGGISPDAVKPVVDRFYELVRQGAAAREQADMEAGKKAMAEMWGVKARENAARVMRTVTFLDGKLGGERFSKALAATGAANNVDLIAGIYELARMMGEATLGDAFAGGGGDAAETPETAYAKWFK